MNRRQLLVDLGVNLAALLPPNHWAEAAATAAATPDAHAAAWLSVPGSLRAVVDDIAVRVERSSIEVTTFNDPAPKYIQGLARSHVEMSITARSLAAAGSGMLSVLRSLGQVTLGVDLGGGRAMSAQVMIDRISNAGDAFAYEISGLISGPWGPDEMPAPQPPEPVADLPRRRTRGISVKGLGDD